VRFDGARFETEVTYTRIAAQPLYGLTENASEIQSAAAFKFENYWSVFGSLTYDINRQSLSRNGFGFSYDDRDTVFSVVYEQTRDKSGTTANDWSIGARLMFRTLGDINVGDTTLTGFE
jgi:LPS-assembly protein